MVPRGPRIDYARDKLFIEIIQKFPCLHGLRGKGGSSSSRRAKDNAWRCVCETMVNSGYAMDGELL